MSIYDVHLRPSLWWLGAGLLPLALLAFAVAPIPDLLSGGAEGALRMSMLMVGLPGTAFCSSCYVCIGPSQRRPAAWLAFGLAVFAVMSALGALLIAGSFFLGGFLILSIVFMPAVVAVPLGAAALAGLALDLLHNLFGRDEPASAARRWSAGSWRGAHTLGAALSYPGWLLFAFVGFMLALATGLKIFVPVLAVGGIVLTHGLVLVRVARRVSPDLPRPGASARLAATMGAAAVLAGLSILSDLVIQS